MQKEVALKGVAEVNLQAHDDVASKISEIRCRPDHKDMHVRFWEHPP